MKIFNKITAMFLSALFIFNMLPVAAYAAEDITVPESEELNFLYENGFIMGEIVDYNENMDSISVDVYYPSIELYANIRYAELNNDDVSVTITEGTKSNTYIYSSGEVYFEGMRIDSNNEVMPVNSYAYSSYEKLEYVPGSWPNTFSNESRFTDVLVFTIPIQNLTVTALAQILAQRFSQTNHYAWFLFAANNILSMIIACAINVLGIEFTWKTSTNYEKAPLEYVRKHTISFYIRELNLPVEGSVTYFVHEVLI